MNESTFTPQALSIDIAAQTSDGDGEYWKIDIFDFLGMHDWERIGDLSDLQFEGVICACFVLMD